MRMIKVQVFVLVLAVASQVCEGMYWYRTPRPGVMPYPEEVPVGYNPPVKDIEGLYSPPVYGSGWDNIGGEIDNWYGGYKAVGGGYFPYRGWKAPETVRTLELKKELPTGETSDHYVLTITNYKAYKAAVKAAIKAATALEGLPVPPVHPGIMPDPYH